MSFEDKSAITEANLSMATALPPDALGNSGAACLGCSRNRKEAVV